MLLGLLAVELPGELELLIQALLHGFGRQSLRPKSLVLAQKLARLLF